VKRLILFPEVNKQWSFDSLSSHANLWHRLVWG